MSDLQCPATFIVLASDADSGELGSVAARRPARVLTAGSAGARTLAADLGAACGMDAVELPLDVGGYRSTLADVADLYRGETIAVVVDPEVVDDLAAGAPGAEPDSGLVELAIDADGWAVGPWRAVR